MGWDAVIMGRLTLGDAAALERWKGARATIVKARWPGILAPMDDEVGSDQGVVGALLAELGRIRDGHEFLEVNELGNVVAFRGVLGEDTYRDVLSKLVAVLSAALTHDASGRFDVRNAGAHTGGSVEVLAGKLRGRELKGKLGPEDEMMMRDALRGPSAPKPATSPARMDPKILRLQALPKRTAAQERDLRDLLQLAQIKANRSLSPAERKERLGRVESRMKARAKPKK